jgi:Fur family transcriptional regulator, iron response regulator
MSGTPGNASEIEQLRDVGIRPTAPRLAVLRTIREGGRRHLMPEAFHYELADHGIKMSLATVYNTLNHFADAGLLRRVGFGDRTFFCTNPGEHYHFFDEATGRLEDVPDPQPRVVDLPPPPAGMSIEGVEVIIRVRKR